MTALHHILRAACIVAGASIDDAMTVHKRNRRAAYAKTLYVRVALSETHASLPEIAAGVGRKNHSGLYNNGQQPCDPWDLERVLIVLAHLRNQAKRAYDETMRAQPSRTMLEHKLDHLPRAGVFA